jgi:hypothetical protein
MPPGDLEDIVDRALKQLPAPRAPGTLLPRVMAAIEAGRAESAPARAPRARPWVTWPLAWQVASITVAIALGVGAARLWPHAASVAAFSATTLAGDAFAKISATAAETVSTAATVASVTRIVWHALVQPFVGYLMFLVLVMCAACATFGAALGRVVLGGVPQT